jgi:serine/threonine-protein kinase RsbW
MRKYQWLRLPADSNSLEEFRGFVLHRAKQNIKSRKVLYSVKLALEEVLVNVISYAYEGREMGIIDVGCSFITDKKFSIKVRDRGKWFNPLKLTEPDLDLDSDDRPIGGLGIFLAKSVTDEMRYHRDHEHNILTMSYSVKKAIPKRKKASLQQYALAC